MGNRLSCFHEILEKKKKFGAVGGGQVTSCECKIDQIWYYWSLRNHIPVMPI